MEYRFMKSSDLELIVSLEKKARIQEPDVFPKFDEVKFRELFLAQRIEEFEGSDVILCFDNDEVVGRVDLITELSFFDYEKVGYVDWVFVLESYRNKGIAKELFRRAEELFKSKGVSQYYLFVAKNQEAQHFYKSLDIEIKEIQKATRILK